MREKSNQGHSGDWLSGLHSRAFAQDERRVEQDPQILTLSDELTDTLPSSYRNAGSFHLWLCHLKQVTSNGTKAQEAN